MIEPTVVLSRVSYTYPDGRLALNDVCLEIYPSESLAVIGPSGAGKTTLLLHLNGLLRGPGEVRIKGETIKKNNLGLIRRQVGLVFQDPSDQLFMPTLLEDVTFGPLNMDPGRDDIEESAQRLLFDFALEDESGRSADRLSLGQAKKAALASVLIMSPDILALDEPTSNLDPRGRRRLLEILKGLPQTKIIASHDLDFAWELCERAILLDRGSVVAQGPCRTLLRDRNLLEAHGFEVPLSALVGRFE